jgi:hypothetical protein
MRPSTSAKPRMAGHRRTRPPVPRTVKHRTYNRGHPPISLGGCGKGSGDPSGPTGMTSDGLSWSLPTKNPRSSLATSWRSCSRCDPRVGGKGSTGGQAIAVQTVLTSSKHEDQSGRRQHAFLSGLSRRFRPLVAVMLSAALFVACHLVLLTFAYFFALGIALALVRRFHQNLWAPCSVPKAPAVTEGEFQWCLQHRT